MFYAIAAVDATATASPDSVANNGLLLDVDHEAPPLG